MNVKVLQVVTAQIHKETADKCCSQNGTNLRARRYIICPGFQCSSQLIILYTKNEATIIYLLHYLWQQLLLQQH